MPQVNLEVQYSPNTTKIAEYLIQLARQTELVVDFAKEHQSDVLREVTSGKFDFNLSAF